jgi:hypothetical protein
VPCRESTRVGGAPETARRGQLSLVLAGRRDTRNDRSWKLGGVETGPRSLDRCTRYAFCVSPTDGEDCVIVSSVASMILRRLRISNDATSPSSRFRTRRTSG